MEKNRKGFFFTVLALILLSFMFISVQTWAQAQQLREARAAERFRAEALKTAMSVVDQNSLNKFANASLLHSAYFLSKKLGETPCTNYPFLPYDEAGGLYPDGTARAAISMAELSVNGTTHGAPPSVDGPFKCVPLGWMGNITYDDEQMQFSMKSYFNKTASAARLLGFNLTWGEPGNITINQSGYFTIYMQFEVDANLSDSMGFSYVRTLKVNSQADIAGISDPFISGMDRAHRNMAPPISAHRAFFSSDNYSLKSDAAAKVIRPGSEGFGWFFGPVSKEKGISFFSINDRQYNLSRIGTYILVTASPAQAIDQSQHFGGIILVASAGTALVSNVSTGGCWIETYTQKDCVYCKVWKQFTNASNPMCSGVPLPSPFINSSTAFVRHVPYAVVSSNPVDGNSPTMQQNYRLGMPEALITNKKSFLEIFSSYSNPTYNSSTSVTALKNPPSNTSMVVDMTGPRDMAICGYYVPSDYGPSAMKRFTDPRYWGAPPFSQIGGKKLGIESVVTGKWAGGEFDSNNMNNLDNSLLSSEFYSRVDYQFYRPYIGATGAPLGVKCRGPFVKGMPGCRDFGMCNSTAPAGNSTGRFAFDIPPLYAYAYGWQLNVTTKSSLIVGGCE